MDEIISKKERLYNILGLGVELYLKERGDVKVGTKVHVSPSLKGKEKNIQHIDYDLTSVLPLEKNQYSRLTDQEFKLHGWYKKILSEGRMKPINLGDKVIKIKKSLLTNEQVRQLRDSITQNDYVVDDFLFEQCLAIPCILHLKKRVNERLVMTLVLEDLRKCGSAAAINDYFQPLIVLFDNCGMYEKYGQWKLPLSDGKLEYISLSNGNERKVVENYALLFDLVFENHPMGCVSRNMFKNWILDKFASIIEKHRDMVGFNDDDTIDLQRKFDIFYDLWFELCFKYDLTNYIHLLGSVHIIYYLKKYRNIYIFSNQARERLNNRLKMFYLQKSQHGGHGKYPSKVGTSYVCLMVRWIQCILIWNTDLGGRGYILRVQ